MAACSRKLSGYAPAGWNAGADPLYWREGPHRHAVALIQSALGVPRQTIYEGYLTSNLRREIAIWRWTALVWFASRLRTPPSRFRPLLETSACLLAGLF